MPRSGIGNGKTMKRGTVDEKQWPRTRSFSNRTQTQYQI